MPSNNDYELPSTRQTWREHFKQPISKSWTDALLLMGCFTTGLLDSAVFNEWQCFVSMQTGNTIYVGLGVSGQPASSPYRWAKSGISIISFLLGSYTFSTLMRNYQPLHRSTLILSTLSQSLLILIPALLAQLQIIPADAGDLLPNNNIVLLPLALLAFQSAGQCVQSRFLGFQELPSIVLTSAFCDLMMDEKLVERGVRGNSKRNRRLGSIALLIGGAILGGFLTKGEDRGIGAVLWLVGGMKFVWAVCWVFWKAEEGGVRLD